MSLPFKSSVVLWVLAPLLVWLSSVRPPNPRSDRAQGLPTQIGRFHLAEKKKITGGMERLLGTRDVAWWVFEDDAGHQVFLTTVFHDTNWKSLHPPHICIRGSNFNISLDEAVEDDLDDGRRVSVGHLVASVQNKPEISYVSIYAFVGQDFVTPSYTGFYLRHFFPALFRQATSGFQLRVEAFVGPDGQRATEQRCWELFRKFMPVGEARIR